jgi:hypothetical protein
MSVNFEDFFKKGLLAAGAADKTNHEIDSVFQELNDQISIASDGKLAFTLERRRDLTVSLAAMLRPDLSEYNKLKTYLIAKNTLAGKEETIGEFDRASTGYPAHLKYDDQEIYCNDKQALERNLSSMLANVNVGKQLARLLNWPILPEVDSADDE